MLQQWHSYLQFYMKYTNTYLGTYLCCLCSRGMQLPITSIWNRILSKEHRSCHMIASNRSNFPQNTVFKTLKNSAITVSSRLLFYYLDNHFISERSPVYFNINLQKQSLILRAPFSQNLEDFTKTKMWRTVNSHYISTFLRPITTVQNLIY